MPLNAAGRAATALLEPSRELMATAFAIVCNFAPTGDSFRDFLGEAKAIRIELERVDI